MTEKLSPKMELVAFKVWAYCEPKAWDCHLSDIARDIEEPRTRVLTACRARGWLDRLRKKEKDYSFEFGWQKSCMVGGVVDEFDDMDRVE